MSKANIVFVDIEASNLNANFGYMLCGAWKSQQEKKVNCISIADFPLFEKDPTNDKKLVEAYANEISKADIFVGWYSTRYDIPFINSRLIFHGLKPLPPIPHVDGWRIAKYQLKLNSNRLASAASFLGAEQKTPLDGPTWIKAQAGHKSSISYVVKHCKQDIVVLEQVYEKIKMLAKNHPNVNLVSNGSTDACPICGTVGRLQKRGFTIAQTSRKQRWQCQKCGAWSHGRPEKIEGVTIR